MRKNNKTRMRNFCFEFNDEIFFKKNLLRLFTVIQDRPRPSHAWPSMKIVFQFRSLPILVSRSLFVQTKKNVEPVHISLVGRQLVSRTMVWVHHRRPTIRRRITRLSRTIYLSLCARLAFTLWWFFQLSGHRRSLRSSLHQHTQWKTIGFPFLPSIH